MVVGRQEALRVPYDSSVWFQIPAKIDFFGLLKYDLPEITTETLKPFYKAFLVWPDTLKPNLELRLSEDFNP